MIGLFRPLKSKRVPGHWRFLLTLLLATALAAAVPVLPAVAGSGYTLPPSTQLTAAAYGNGVYVVAGTSSAGSGSSAIGSFVVLTSTDGANWTVTQPLPNMNIWNIYQIAYGNGIFVAVGRMPGKEHDSGVVLTSSDGIHWAENSFDIKLTNIAYGNGTFVLIGYNDNYTSTDGVNWTPISKQYDTALYEFSPLIYTGNVFADFNQTQFGSSQNGTIWQTEDMGIIDYSGTGMIYPNIGVAGAAYADNGYVAVGTYYPNTPTNPYPIVITSQDGIKWTMTKLNESFSTWNGIAYGNGTFMANAADGSILTSPDGLTWTTRDTGANTSYKAVFFCNGQFMALGGDGTVFTTTDGINWSNHQPAATVSPVSTPTPTGVIARFLIGQDFYYPGSGDGTKIAMDAVPYIDSSSGRTLVPVRYLGDALGAQTNWDANTQTVTVTKDSTTISMVIGSTTLTVNGQTQTMDQAPVIWDGRTYLPARYVAEALGYTVSWDANSQTVTVTPGS
jgi:hypothetical protein